MLLDAWTSIFLWIGRSKKTIHRKFVDFKSNNNHVYLDSNKTELKDAERIAHDYLQTDPSHRDPDTPIIKTKQTHEPIHFIGFFGPWDRNYWTVKNITCFRDYCCQTIVYV